MSDPRVQEIATIQARNLGLHGSPSPLLTVLEPLSETSMQYLEIHIQITM